MKTNRYTDHKKITPSRMHWKVKYRTLRYPLRTRYPGNKIRGDDDSFYWRNLYHSNYKRLMKYSPEVKIRTWLGTCDGYSVVGYLFARQFQPPRVSIITVPYQ